MSEMGDGWVILWRPEGCSEWDLWRGEEDGVTQTFKPCPHEEVVASIPGSERMRTSLRAILQMARDARRVRDGNNLGRIEVSAWYGLTGKPSGDGLPGLSAAIPVEAPSQPVVVSDEMIERAAKALHEGDQLATEDWEDEDDDHREAVRNEARIALAAALATGEGQ